MKAKKDSTPTPEQLATIAAQLMGASKGDPMIASARAAELWDACKSEIIEWERRLEKLDILSDEQENRIINGPTPEESMCAELGVSPPTKRIMTFKEVMKLLMPRLTIGDRLSRIRDYLSETSNLKREDAGAEIAKLQQQKFTVRRYILFASRYADWWEWHKKKVRSQAGKKGRHSPRRKR